MAEDVAKADWPQIGDIIPNHDGDRPSGTAVLSGLRTVLQLDVPVAVEFGAQQLVWVENEVRTELEYEAFALGRQLFLVDAMPAAPDRRSMTMIWDVGAMRALVAETTFPTPEQAQSPVLERLSRTGQQSAVRVRYRQGGIGRATTAQFSRSTALVGRLLRYRYSDTHEYDHIYHSERFYSWYCRQGPDRGLGDFEECDVFGLHEDLYFVSWREKLLPCVGIMVEDHERMRALGKICGADAYTGVIANTRVGAAISRIS